MFKEEIPVLNRITSIWSECELYGVTLITEHVQKEIHYIVYLSQFNEEVKRDTVETNVTINDTTTVYIPKFAYIKESSDIIRDNLEYIGNNLDVLSPETYIEIVNLLSFIHQHPIEYEEDGYTRFHSDWSDQKTYSEFFELIGNIYASYSRRQLKYLY